MKSKISAFVTKFKNLPKKRKIIIVAGIIIVLLFLIINRSKSDSGMYTEEVVKTQDINTFYSFSGNIESNDIQEVVSISNLSVKKFHVEEGDQVKVGDLLLELDDNTIASSLKQAEAGVELAKINLDMAKGASKNQQLTQAKLNLNTAQLNYDAAISTSKDQQSLQITNALKAAQLAFDNATLQLERVKGLYEIGGASQVDVEQAQTAYDQALMQLNAAQVNFDNMEKTINQSIELAKEQLEAAEKSYNALVDSLNNNIRIAEEQLIQAEASYDLLKEQLDDTRIYAEVDGEVSEIHVTENQSIIMGTPIMDVVDHNNFIVKLKVDEYDLKAISLGKKAEVTISALGEKVVGTVTDISKQAKVVEGVSFFETTIKLEDNEHLRVGISTEVIMPHESVKNATTISMKALQFDDENKPYVYYRDSKGSISTKAVTVGINDGIIVEILEGVESGETILVPRTYPDFLMTES
ncbi:MAG: HlyD family efflux transporter periplasmic adaptor subunit [Tissierellia bacterium]|nr:HlyD family efflux transporter periplasmic adaptor subunit [Tissierellia bacterium]